MLGIAVRLGRFRRKADNTVFLLCRIHNWLPFFLSPFCLLFIVVDYGCEVAIGIVSIVINMAKAVESRRN